MNVQGLVEQRTSRWVRVFRRNHHSGLGWWGVDYVGEYTDDEWATEENQT